MSKIITIVAVLMILAALTGGYLFVSKGGLTPARNLSGHWEGTCPYTMLDSDGAPRFQVVATCDMDLNQRGNQLTGALNLHPKSYKNVGSGIAAPPIDDQILINGIINGTRFSFNRRGASAQIPFAEEYEFSFTTDILSGSVRNLDDVAFLGMVSEPQAFRLMRK